jgi:hypothetical protein
MTDEDRHFLEAVITAGAILAGFCSSFLAFRIQREANYYRQPVLSYERGQGRDVYLGLTHFTSSFLLIILAAACSMSFGFVLPLLALATDFGGSVIRGLVVGGLVAALILVAGYFWDELVHYEILRGHLLLDLREKRKERPIMIGTLTAALVVPTLLAYWLIRRSG